LPEDLKSLTQALPTSSTGISKRKIVLIFGFMGTAFSAFNAVQIYYLQKENMAKSNKTAILTYIFQIQEEHLEHLEKKMILEIK
jgi:hypothetical protein